jgi:hypothetical protein
MTQPPDHVDTLDLLKGRPTDPAKLRALRWAVIAMGVVLLAGFGAVVARIVYLTTRTSPTDVTQAVKTGPAIRSLVSRIDVVLPANAKIVSQSLSAGTLAIHYDVNGLASIVIVDLETGLPVSTLHINNGSK